MTEYIEKEAAENFFREARKRIDKRNPDFLTRDSMLLNAEQIIHLMDAADVKPVVHGKWIKSTVFTAGNWYGCSACSRYWISADETYDFNFCPNCGADMRGES